MRAWILSVAVALSLISLSACHLGPETLYDRLGGEVGLNQVLDDFVVNVGNDPRISPYFADVNTKRLRKHLYDQICAASGGPCSYTGRTMRESHPPSMGVTDAAFNALIEDLVKSLNKFKVQPQEQADLLALLDPLKPDIVTKH